ncbi:MAG: type II toxin-antitoxin system VapC family toxin [Planctomycetaceae bacterium]
MSYLLDTDIVSAHLKTNRRVTDRILQYLGRVHVSVITVGELTTWARRKQASRSRVMELDAFLQDATILPVTEMIARHFGALRAELLDIGRPTPTMDLWIAATALVHNLTLVTHNQQDFAHIPGLSLVDWTVE